MADKAGSGLAVPIEAAMQGAEAGRFDWQTYAKSGLLAGGIAVFLSLVGLIEASSERDIIEGVLSMGQVLLLLAFVYGGYRAAHSTRTEGEAEPPRLWVLASGAIAGILTSAMLVLLVLLGSLIDLRTVFIKASPELYDLLTLGLGVPLGTIALLLLGAILGAATASLLLLPGRTRQAVVVSLTIIPVIAIVNSAFFAGGGLPLWVAAIVLIVAAGATYTWSRSQTTVKARVESMPTTGQRALRLAAWGLAAAVVLALPLLGSYPAEVFDLVGLFALMGLGLNIVVGFAGLLDLGYVAFFALGAYTIGVLTSPEIAWTGIHLTFWGALPFAVGVATLAGIILGIPVLGMRGDYLAIVTLGFGEIIRLVALSDWLKPYIGGSNGITRIPKPVLGPIVFDDQQSLYFLILVGILLAVFVSTRTKYSRLGRAWMALREDEDVAQAMGIDLVRTKLMAFATGAAFAGLAGAFFATKLTSIYPHSFNLLISINVLCVVIVGGMGSIPGMIIGALALVGLPEILREFSEYRLLLYGAALVLMMLNRPEGLLPEARRRLELHEETGGGGQ